VCDLKPQQSGDLGSLGLSSHGGKKKTKIQFVPRSKQITFRLKTNQFMLCGKIKTVRSEIHAKHISALCGQDVELFNVKSGGT